MLFLKAQATWWIVMPWGDEKEKESGFKNNNNNKLQAPYIPDWTNDVCFFGPEAVPDSRILGLYKLTVTTLRIVDRDNLE